jgi:hypothetical protein
MIDAGEVFAEIDEAAGMVRFLDDPERYDAASVVSRIDAQIQASIAVGQRVKYLNQRVQFPALPCRQLCEQVWRHMQRGPTCAVLQPCRWPATSST